MIARVFSDTVKRVRDLGKRCRRQRVRFSGRLSRMIRRPLVGVSINNVGAAVVIHCP